MARIAPQAPVVIPTTSQPNPSYFEQSAKNTLIQLTKISRISHRGRAASLAKNPEVQTLLDNDFFMIQPDRRSKLTPMQQYRLVQILAQFFLERVEDGNRYSYFEAIFLGREGDSTIHDFRIDMLLQLISFSLQFPILQVFNHVSNWLSKISDENQALYYSNLVVDMVVDHYIKTPDTKSKMYEFLLPLEFSCGEFTATFVALAPLHSEMNSALCLIITSFMQKNILFLMRHLRDTPYLGDQFAKNTFPIIIKYILKQQDHSLNVIRQLVSSVCFIMQKWEEKVIGVGRETTTKTPIDVMDLVLSNEYEWSKNRCIIVASAAKNGTIKKDELEDKLEQLEVPEEFVEMIAKFSQEVKNVRDELEELDIRLLLEKSNTPPP